MPAPHAIAATRAVRDVDRYDELHHVPATVSGAIAAVHRYGWDDMYDRETVLTLMASLGWPDEAEWLAARRHLYFIALAQSGVGSN